MVSQHRLESFFYEIKCNGMTIFMEFIRSAFAANLYFSLQSRLMYLSVVAPVPFLALASAFTNGLFLRLTVYLQSHAI